MHARTRPRSPRTLDDLAALDVAALEALYRDGKVPESLSALDGSPVCRMLAVRGLDAGPAARLLRTFAASRLMPWAGKTFRAADGASGEGVNRVRLAGTRRWFAFETRVAPSALDGAPCILLDYAARPNPWPIRKIRDELREVAPGLFLGPALIDPDKLVLFFACQRNE